MHVALSEKREITDPITAVWGPYSSKPNFSLHFNQIKQVDTNGKMELGTWFKCREKFHEIWDQPLICFGTKYPRKFLEFIRITEDRISKLSGEQIQGTTAGRTNYKGITWLQVDEWWMSEKMRMSFFSELIRAATLYNRPLSTTDKLQHAINVLPTGTPTLPKRIDYWTAMWLKPHLKATQQAAMRFLDGYTHYTGSSNMWFKAMFVGELSNQKNLTVDDISPVRGRLLEKLLVKPKLNNQQKKVQTNPT